MAAPSASTPFRIVHTVCSRDCPDVLVTVNAEGRAATFHSTMVEVTRA